MASVRRGTDVRRGSIGKATFCIERPKKPVGGRVFIFPGLLGTENTYRQASSFITEKLPLEVVTMTHGREARRLFAPMKARSMDCRAVFRLLGVGSLPNYFLGHSLGGADAVHVADFEEGQGIAGIGLETSVGMSDVKPKAGDVMGSMWSNLRRLPRDFLAESVRYVASNPPLAAAEAAHAKNSDISGVASGLGSLILHEAYNGGDVVVRPPSHQGQHLVRGRELNHIAICEVPEVSLDHAERFMNHAETLASRVAV